ncbi:response regulator [Photobacterium halotolerans]|uniref:Nitrate/nitrite response regulator n=1 Tax=Photobacterium halotolerans TaxID=265726 RepID=A0A0F5VAX8_9GAMM|nr:response regulator [Photobacterium halotolerans]KKC98936.1 nitrate/nitrite response regulator [Photobacterium halotolerans]
MSNTPAYRVLIVDDHPLMRRGLGQLLELEAGFELVGEASNGYQALDLASEHDPDLIVLDLNMKGISGLDTLRALREQNCQAIVVILTVSDNPSDIRALIKAGADGYLLKDTEPEQLLVLLHQAVAGQQVFSHQISQYLADSANTEDPLNELTGREKEILHLVAQGKRNKDIAVQLFISEATVKVHIKSLLKKLDVGSRTAATVIYLQTQDR